MTYNPALLLDLLRNGTPRREAFAATGYTYEGGRYKVKQWQRRGDLPTRSYRKFER